MTSKLTFNYHFSLLFALLVIFSAGCKKDKEKEETKTEKLTGKTWKITAHTVNPGYVAPGGTTITDLYASTLFTPSCDKDDVITFNTNKTFTSDEGATKCSTSSPQTTTGPWTFNTDETILTINNTLSIKIDQLDSTTLKGTYTEDDTSTGVLVTYTHTLTLTRQ